jgi:thiosulfate dehydrogenase
MNWPVAGKMVAGGTLAIAFVATLSYLGYEKPAEIRHPTREATASRAAPVFVSQASPGPAALKSNEWTVPDIDTLSDDAWGRMVRMGRDLTVETYAHLGPEVVDPSKRFTGTSMACQSCHLEAGTKQFGLPFIGVFADFPQYRAREGEVGTLEDRVNGCMTRSMNGRALPVDSEPMKAFVAYIKFLSTGRPIGGRTPGRGSGEMPELTRAADPKAGAEVYARSCAACHGADGGGNRLGAVGDGKGYAFPPLWGAASFNNGAGMARLISAANFIRSNMPNGATHDAPVLTAEEAWDVAAYVESMDRPQKRDVERDFPVRIEKPPDAAYGPYVDGFPQDQHKYGPFQPIRDKLKAMQSGNAKPAAQ